MTAPSQAVIVSSGPIGAAPCETQGRISTPSKRTPTAPARHDLLAEQERRLGIGRAGRSKPAEQRQHRRRAGELAQHRVGREGEGVREQQHAGGAGQLREPAEHAVALAQQLHFGVEGGRLAAVERSGPDRDGGAVLDLAHLADHARRAAADERGRGERLVDTLERRFRRDQMSPGGEHHREIARPPAQGVARRCRGLGGAEARVRVGREPAADAYGHRHGPYLPSLRARSTVKAPGAVARARAILTAVAALPLVALFGPTGVGKTEIALELADLLRAEGEDPVAVSADALQLYEGLEILTGAASQAERERLEHRLLGVLPITARATAGDYARRAHAEIDGLIAAGTASARGRRDRPLPARRARRARPAPAAGPADPRALCAAAGGRGRARAAR